MFDTINPETLQVDKYDVTKDEASIYAKRNPSIEDMTAGNVSEPLNWNRNQALQEDVLKKESFNKRMTDIAGTQKEVKSSATVSGDRGKLLDAYEIKDDSNTSRRVKSTMTVHTSTADSLSDLYTRVLPELRSELRQGGLRQIGFVRFNTATPQESSDELLTKLRKPTKDSHNAFDPMAFEDPSLRVLAPKQWKGNLPTTAKDDIIQSAIHGLLTRFHPSNNIIQQGEPIQYDFYVYQENQTREMWNALSAITVQLVVSFSQIETSRTLTQAKHSFHFTHQHGNEGFGISKENQSLNLDSSSLQPGNYQMFAQVFLLMPNTARTLLSSHGPFDLFLVSNQSSPKRK